MKETIILRGIQEVIQEFGRVSTKRSCYLASVGYTHVLLQVLSLLHHGNRQALILSFHYQSDFKYCSSNISASMYCLSGTGLRT